MPFHLKRRYKISVSHFNIHTALARFEREASSTTNLIQSSNFSLLQWNKNCIIRTRNTKLMAMLRMISSQNKQKYAQLLYYFFFCSTLLRLGGVETRWSPTTVSTCWWTGPLELQQTHTCRSGTRTAFHEPNPKRTASGAQKQSLLLNQWIKLLELFGIWNVWYNLGVLITEQALTPTIWQ